MYTTMVTLVLGLWAVSPLAAAGVAVAGDRGDKKEQEAKTESVRGILQGVDNNQIRIRGDATTLLAIRLDSQTKITLDGKDAGITDLKAGQAISCTYIRREGINLGLAIAARSAKK